MSCNNPEITACLRLFPPNAFMKKAGYVGPLRLSAMGPLWQKHWQFIHVADVDMNVVVVVAFEFKVSFNNFSHMTMDS